MIRLTPVSVVLGLLLLPVGLFYSIRARRWRQVLAEHAWQAAQYHYTEHVITTVSTSYEGESTIVTRVMGQLTILEPSDRTSQRWVNVDRVWAPLARWRLRPWRQAPPQEPHQRYIIAS